MAKKKAGKRAAVGAKKKGPRPGPSPLAGTSCVPKKKKR